MTSNVIQLADFAARRRVCHPTLVGSVVRAFTKLTLEERARLAYNEVLKRCDALGIPRANSERQADACERTVLSGHEPSAAAARAVDRAFRTAFPDTPPPSAA